MRLASLLAAILVLVLADMAPTSADERPGLFENGTAVPLRDGLTVRADGAVWITRKDLTSGLRVIVRELIPPIGDPDRRARQRKKLPPRVFVLSQHDFSVRFEEQQVDTSVPGNEAFPLKAVARALGWTLRTRANGFDLVPANRRARRGTKPGDRFPGLVLEDLAGQPRSLDALRGKRVLIVVWASWSPSRETLATWAVEWKLRADRGLELFAVAVDVEGAERVRPYLPPGIEAKVVIDRNGAVPGLVGSNEVGRFVLLDELGVVRARGDGPEVSTLLWIDRHLDEPLVAVEETTVSESDADRASVEVLRARIERRPEDAAARLALVNALEAAGELALATVELEALWAQKKHQPSLAMRIARLCIDQANRPKAMNVLDETRRQHRGAMWLRNQRWALEHPERFYEGSIDTAWLKAQKKAEDEELGRRRR